MRAAVILFFLSTPLMAQNSQNVALKDAKGKEVGQVQLTSLANGVRVRLDLHSLPPGEKALHFHETGSCKAPKFTSAGGHFAPAKNPHGFDAEKGPHAGDMPNIFVGKDGRAKLEVINTQVTLGTGSNSLKKAGGTALVIHAAADDYKSQPAGNAGDRIACGEIKGG